MISIASFEIAGSTTTAGPDVGTNGTVLLRTDIPDYLKVGGSQAEADDANALALDQMPFVSGRWYPFAVSNLNEVWFKNTSASAVRVWYFIGPVYVMGDA